MSYREQAFAMTVNYTFKRYLKTFTEQEEGSGRTEHPGDLILDPGDARCPRCAFEDERGETGEWDGPPDKLMDEGE